MAGHWFTVQSTDCSVSSSSGSKVSWRFWCVKQYAIPSAILTNFIRFNVLISTAILSDLFMIRMKNFFSRAQTFGLYWFKISNTLVFLIVGGGAISEGVGNLFVFYIKLQMVFFRQFIKEKREITHEEKKSSVIWPNRNLLRNLRDLRNPINLVRWRCERFSHRHKNEWTRVE